MMSPMNSERNTHPIVWEDLTWEELPNALEACGNTALWPFGATEQHGPHLGTGVDTMIARAVCEEVSRLTQVPVLPVMPVGCSMGHSRKWPGTLSMSPRTMIAMVVEIGEWLHAAGVRRLFFINAHVTNFAPLRCALEELRFKFHDLQIALINTAEISPRVREYFFAEGDDWHANAAETSLMLFLREKATRAGRFASSDDPDRTGGLQFSHPVNLASMHGVTGFPSRASLLQGAEIFALMVEDLSVRVRVGCMESPPLRHAENP